MRKTAHRLLVASSAFAVGLLVLGVPRAGHATSIDFISHEASADTWAFAGTVERDPDPSVRDGRIALATSVVALPKGGVGQEPSRPGVAIGSAKTLLLAAVGGNLLKFTSTVSVATRARAPTTAAATAQSSGTIVFDVAPDLPVPIGNQLALDLELFGLTQRTDPAVEATRSFLVRNLTSGTVLFDSGISGFPSDLSLVGIEGGDRILIEFDQGLSGDTSLPGRQAGKLRFRGVAKIEIVPIPEPTTLTLLAGGLLAVGLARRPRR